MDYQEILDSMTPFNTKMIKIKYHADIPELKMTDFGDGIDLYTAQDYVLHEGEFKLISQGVSMELPEGYEAILAPRSSTFKRGGLIQTNGIGVIDNMYCGDNDIGLFPALATRHVEIPAGSRICQFRIQRKQPKIVFKTVDSLGNKDRNGIGSTGDGAL